MQLILLNSNLFCKNVFLPNSIDKGGLLNSASYYRYLRLFFFAQSGKHFAYKIRAKYSFITDCVMRIVFRGILIDGGSLWIKK